MEFAARRTQKEVNRKDNAIRSRTQKGRKF